MQKLAKDTKQHDHTIRSDEDLNQRAYNKQAHAQF
jgi:hypothetical protein